LAQGPLLHLQSQRCSIFNCLLFSDLHFHFISLFLFLLSPSFSYEVPYDYIGPTWITQNTLYTLYLDILTLIISAKSHLPCEVTCSPVLRIRTWKALECRHSAVVSHEREGTLPSLVF
jgi:hypothetical protein